MTLAANIPTKVHRATVSTEDANIKARSSSIFITLEVPLYKRYTEYINAAPATATFSQRIGSKNEIPDKNSGVAVTVVNTRHSSSDTSPPYVFSIQCMQVAIKATAPHIAK